MRSVEVDPTIAQIIGEADRPRDVPARVRPPSSLPGRLGWGASLQYFLRLPRHGVAFLEGERARYGDIYRGMTWLEPGVFVWDADEILRVLKNDDNVWSTAMGYDIFMKSVYVDRPANVGGPLSLDFEAHRAAHAQLQPGFTSSALQGYVPVLDRHFSAAVSRYLEQGEIDFKPAIRKLLATASNELFTGISAPDEVARLDRSIVAVFRGTLALFMNRADPMFRAARAGYQHLFETFVRLVPERRRAGGSDLFSRLAAEGALPDDVLVRLFIFLMVMAYETTAKALASMGYLLARHPDWQERLRSELGQVKARAAGAMTTEAPDFECAWKETLRLMPILPALPRRALRSVEIGGHRLDPGTNVFLMIGGVGRHPKWWSEPERFDPERFSSERAEHKRHPGIFLPFGAGAHACVGMQLATLEARRFWSEMLTRCRFTLKTDYAARHTHTPMGCVSGKIRLALEPL